MNQTERFEQKESYRLYRNENGPEIGVADAPVIEQDGLIFRDLERTGELLPYEDWRLDAAERAKDLAARLTVEEIAGLMMYSPHQMIPNIPGGPFKATYDGKPFPESGKEPWAMSDQQKAFLTDDHVRHVLVMKLQDALTAARWSNAMQAFAEKLPHGIPINVSSDPRHGAGAATAEYKGGAGDVSKWPEGLGMAATFSEELCYAYGKTVSQEYRALGITTALSPQVDLGTEPRWMRIEDTFGTDPDMVTRMGRAYCDSMQTTEGAPNGWGRDSVCAMAKHWPGGGPCEAGRDAHYAFGKYAVYPGKQLEKHMKPFVEGAFNLNGPTKTVAAIMPYYTISTDVDPEARVGNSYSRHIIRDMLREQQGYDGVVCTDWGITGDPLEEMDSFGSRCFGVENLSEAERHLRIIENGVDQFGGNSNIKPILEAYRIGCERHGEEAMRKRMERSAVRLLTSMFRCGLFDNPYLDPEESAAIVGCEANCRAGFEAQLRSIVMLKNQHALPQKKGMKVYIPGRSIKARKAFFRNLLPEMQIPGADQSIVSEYFQWADTPEEADFALVCIESPLTDGGYTREDRENGGNGYLPISLQYRPYTADTARAESIGQGDFREAEGNRSYRGKTCYTANEADLDIVIDAKRAMGDRPVIVSMRMHNPTVMAELEPYADAILVNFGVQQQAVLETVCGASEPSGRLPVDLPANMETVETHAEDTPFDYEAYTDSEGHTYAYGFGLNWQGIIE